MKRILSLVLLVGFAAIHGALADDGLCDPRLMPIEGWLGYRYRTDKGDSRCEGFYAYRVTVGARRKLELVSLLRGKLQYDLDEIPILMVSAPDMADRPTSIVRVRGLALQPRISYRMDGVIPQGRAMRWPVSAVLAPAYLQENNVGVFGFTRDGENEVYTPLSITGETPEDFPGGTAQVRLMIRPNADISHLGWRFLVEAKRDEGFSPWQRLDIAVPAGRITEIVIPNGESSILWIEVAARLRTDPGDWVLLRFQMYRGQAE